MYGDDRLGISSSGPALPPFRGAYPNGFEIDWTENSASLSSARSGVPSLGAPLTGAGAGARSQEAAAALTPGEDLSRGTYGAPTDAKPAPAV